MGQLNIISSSSSLTLIIIISLAFVIFGVVYSKKYQGLENYLVANRSVGVFSLTTSLVASALGAWILFGPASAATWGGIGAVIGYALGTAFPLFILVFLGKKFRKLYPKGSDVQLLVQPEDFEHDDKSNLKLEVVDRKFRGTNFIYTLKTLSNLLIPVFIHSHHIHQHEVDEKFGIKRPIYIDHIVCF